MKRLSVLLAIASLCVSPLHVLAVDAQTTKMLARMETKFFQHTYDSDSVEQRTERLEKLILGSPMTGDPQDRITKLAATTGAADEEAQAESPASNTTPVTTAPQAQQPITDDSQSDDTSYSDSSSYPRITALETTILSKTYVGQPLADRISRLEKTAFGKVSTSDDMGARADALEQYADKKYHKKFADQREKIEHIQTADATGSGASDQSQGQAQTSEKRGGAVAKTVVAAAANALLGLASMGSPVGFGGFGPGAFGMMPPSRSSGGQRNSDQSDSNQDKPSDDPIITAATPPPPNARMISKVGWLEMQVYGRTYTDMHLEERLEQLSAELHFDMSKSGIQLMDHVGDMIKLVQSRKPAPTTVGASPAAATH